MKSGAITLIQLRDRNQRSNNGAMETVRKTRMKSLMGSFLVPPGADAREDGPRNSRKKKHSFFSVSGFLDTDMGTRTGRRLG